MKGIVIIGGFNPVSDIALLLDARGIRFKYHMINGRTLFEGSRKIVIHDELSVSEVIDIIGYDTARVTGLSLFTIYVEPL